MLYSEKLKEIMEKFGVDTSNLPNNLYSTMLDAIGNANVTHEKEIIYQPVVNDENVTEYMMSLMNKTVETLVIPEGVLYIPTEFCSQLPNLKTVVLPTTLKSIHSYAFNGCGALESVNFNEGVSSISSSAFRNCSKLASLTLPNSLKKIDYNAFQDCYRLNIIRFGSGIETLEDMCFKNTGVVSVTLPNSIKSISSRSFVDCKNLVEINVPWAEGKIANAPWGATNAKINYDYKG